MPRPFGYKVTEETKHRISCTKKKLGQHPIPWERNENIDIECNTCGKIFSVVFSRRNKAKYCSTNCRHAGLIGKAAYNKSKFYSTTYGSLHYKVRKIRGTPKECEECKTTTAKKYDWANLTGKYYDPYDYKRLCVSCHNKLDNKIQNINKNKLIVKSKAEEL